LTGQNKTKKKCLTCGKVKPIDRFELDRRVNGYRLNHCRPCRQSGKRKKISESPYAYTNNLYSQLRSRRKKTHEFTLEKEDLHDMYDQQEGLCAYSGMIMTYIKDGTGYHHTNISIDRIDNDLGYTKENVCLVCLAINMMKYTLDLNELIEWSILIADNHKEKR
jgi:hypothetical protein|tara:strand:- start:101 stop:592 length:492 start_codon:yes stop_codon:yes gene_type:complete